MRKIAQSRMLPPHMENNDTELVVSPRTIRGSKKNEHEELLEQLRAHVDIPDDYHPIMSMAIIANSPRLPLNLQFKAHESVAQYLFRKLKPAEAPPSSAGIVPVAIMRLQRDDALNVPNVVIEDDV